MSLSDQKPEVEDYQKRVEYKWVLPHLVPGNPEEEKKSIDNILKNGELDSELVFKLMDKLITRVHALSQESHQYFIQRMEEWYSDAVKRYEAYLKEQKDKKKKETEKK
jgi:hypothetical protein